MQYFKLEWLKDDKADIEWESNGRAYQKEFLKCCDILSPNLVKILKEDAFHDALIQAIIFQKVLDSDKSKFNVALMLKYKGREGKLIHYDVQEFRSTLQNLGQYIEFGDYLYGEFLLDKQGYWTHDFLLLNDSEINIRCKKIEWLES